MRKIVLSILILVSAIILFLFTYDFRAEQEQFFYAYELSHDELDMIQDGDIILRHGYGLVSDMIVKTLKEKISLSHCAIVVRNDSLFGVVHSVSQSVSDADGVQYQDINTFTKHSKMNSIILVRLRSEDSVIGEKISKRALHYYNLKVPFDHSFDLFDDSKFYCSEIVWKVIDDVAKIDIFPDKSEKSKRYLNFSNFYDSDFFDVIINHNTNR